MRPSFTASSSTQAKRLPISMMSCLSHLLVATAAFQVGFMMGSGAHVHTISSSSSEMCSVPTTLISEQQLSSFQRRNEALPITTTTTTTTTSSSSSASSPQETILPPSIHQFVASAGLVDRDDFISTFDLGFPFFPSSSGNSDVLMLYSSSKTKPSQAGDSNHTGPFPRYASAQQATEHCSTLKVILLQPKSIQCVAIMGQWESFHIHKLLRVIPDEDRATAKRANKPMVSSSYPLRYTSRYTKNDGTQVQIPYQRGTEDYWGMLTDYLQRYKPTMDRLRPLAVKAAGSGKTVIVMVCNFGQSELLFNFMCSARARGLDVSKILLFATDKETADLAKSLDMNVFDVGDDFGAMPTHAAKAYGDRAFVGMMFAKVYCIHLINAMGYNILFADADVIWYKNPLEYFEKEQAGDFDMIFQDDGARSTRYAPYSPNTGFYYVKFNQRTRYFFSLFARMGDQVVAQKSHQSVLNALLAEQASAIGLTVKVLDRDNEEGQLFPGGFHYHQRKDFMKRILQGAERLKPYVFHMSWTKNKENKLKFYQQMGEWYLKDQCIAKPLDQIKETSSLDPFLLRGECCAAEPIITCHYRDKPSKIPCRDSDPIDKGKKSFW